MRSVILIIALLTVYLIPIKADSDPDRSWIQCSKDIAVSLILQGQTVDVHIKNTSTKTQTIIHDGQFVRLFFIDNDEHEVGLKYKFYNDFRDDDPGPVKGPMDIGANSELGVSEHVPLSTEDVEFAKTHPIACKMNFLNPKTGKAYALESPPKILAQKK